eukprot:g10470.t1
MQFAFKEAFKGKTNIDQNKNKKPIPFSKERPNVNVFYLTRSSPQEFRVCIKPEDIAETRSKSEQSCLCFTFGQDEGTKVAFGFGNPHPEPRKTEFRHYISEKIKNHNEFWIYCDAKTGLTAVGEGTKVILSCQMDKNKLANLSEVVLSNWEQSIKVTVDTEDKWEICQKILAKNSNKFDINGKAKPYRGLTTVCMLSSNSLLHRIMVEVSRRLNDSSFKGHYKTLPYDSYHMTVCDLISGEKYKEDQEKYQQTEDEYNKSKKQKFKLFKESAIYTTFAMRAIGLDDNAKSIELEPWNDEVADALDRWRSKVSNCIIGKVADPVARSVEQYRQNRKGYYRFHMTIAYEIFSQGKSEESKSAKKRLIEEAKRAIQQLGPIICSNPQLCHFEDMKAYNPL